MSDRLTELGPLIGSVTAAVTALWLGIRSVWKMGAHIHSILKLVEQELKPNGGGSIKDTMDRIEMRINNNEAALEHLLVRMRLRDGGSWDGAGRRNSDGIEGAAI